MKRLIEIVERFDGEIRIGRDSTYAATKTTVVNVVLPCLNATMLVSAINAMCDALKIGADQISVKGMVDKIVLRYYFRPEKRER